jgi:GlpG protein
MRKIGDIGKADQAAVFSDFLYSKGVANTIEARDGGVFEVWCDDEDALAPGREALARYLADPALPEFAAASRAAAERRRLGRRREEPFARTLQERGNRIRRGFLPGVPVTRLLIILSLVATVFGGLGSGSRLTQKLSVTEYTEQENLLVYDQSLPEVVHGEVWRLVTPIFLHAALMAGAGVLHLLFNMLWLRDLGGMLEKAQGSYGLLVKVLVIGIFSNLLQFSMVGPAFGGMSGVVYGLLGYIWIRGRLDLTSGLYVSSQTTMMMTLWFFLCLSGAMGAIANASHAGGLLSGVTWGWLAAWRVNTRR